MTVENTQYIYLLHIFCFLPELMLFSFQSLRCCNHSQRQQFKANNLKKSLCLVSKENEELKGKSKDYKDLENPTENEPFN